MGYLGEIRLFAGTFAPTGWHVCDGSVLAISDYTDLYEAIGPTYGGDGVTTFGLPSLGLAVPIHWSSEYAIGSSNTASLSVAAQPAAILYMIAMVTPSQDLPFLGEIRTYAFDLVPKGWAVCDGSTLNVQDNTALFSLLDYRYGGQGSTFALPDLRANTVPTSSKSPASTIGYVVTNLCISTEGIFPPEG